MSKQSEKLKSSVVDVQIRAIFNQAVLAGTQVYAVVMSDKLLTFQSDDVGDARGLLIFLKINI